MLLVVSGEPRYRIFNLLENGATIAPHIRSYKSFYLSTIINQKNYFWRVLDLERCESWSKSQRGRSVCGSPGRGKKEEGVAVSRSNPGTFPVQLLNFSIKFHRDLIILMIFGAT